MNILIMYLCWYINIMIEIDIIRIVIVLVVDVIIVIRFLKYKRR